MRTGKTISLLLLLATLNSLNAGELRLYVYAEASKPKRKITDSTYIVEIELKEVKAPAAETILVLSTPDSPQKYSIRVILKDRPRKGWHPLLSIDGVPKKIGISVSGKVASLCIDYDDPEKAKLVAISLGKLFNIPQKKVITEIQ